MASAPERLNWSFELICHDGDTPQAKLEVELGGRLRAVAIDRTGFDAALPKVTLPGGDSEQCCSAGGKTEVLFAGTLAQR